MEGRSDSKQPDPVHDEAYHCEKRDIAVRSMMGFGFDDRNVRQAVAKLLVVYENNWSFIEADSYQALLDFLLDQTGGNGHHQVAETSNITHEDAELSGTAVLTPLPVVKAEEHAEDDSPLPGAPKRTGKRIESVRAKKARLAADQSSPKGKAVLGEQNGTPRKPVKRHDPRDISKGNEPVPIPFVFDQNDPEQKIPEDFCYMKSSVSFDKAHVRINLSSVGETDCCKACFRDCLKKPYGCNCSRDTGGVFPYESVHDQQGKRTDVLLRAELLEQVKKESAGDSSCHRFFHEGDCLMESKNLFSRKCKGHVVRKFIKECWNKCTCHKRDCGNRVVQNGLRYKLEVFWTGPKGWGIRCAHPLPAGAFVCEFVGEILTNTELDERNKSKHMGARHTYPMILNADLCSESIFDDDTLLCLDATNLGNVARFINHRCGDANLVEVPVQIESMDRHFYHVAFFTNRKVDAREELTWDYGIDFEDTDHPIDAFDCICGSKECRKPKARRN